MKLLAKLQASKEFWFLLITSVFFFLLRFPSLFEPYWYGDEGIYEVIGFALTHGRLLYSGIWDNKPPMLYLLYALFSGDQMAAKFLSLLAGLFATWSIFFLSKKLFTQMLPAAITTGIFAFLFGIPFIEGNIANAENFMLLPGILAGLLIFSVLQTPHKPLAIRYKLVAAGLLLGLSFLTKVVAIFDLSAFAVFIFTLSFPSFSLQNTLLAVKKVIPLVIGFMVPIIFCAAFFALHHTLNTFLHATLFSNVGYVNYGNQFIIPQGFLILKTLLVALGVVFFLLQRKHSTPQTLFIFLWVIFSLFAALFSGRPYTHYALVLLPSFSLLLGLFFVNKKQRIFTGVSLLILIIFISKSFIFYNHSLPYYVNFLQYVLGQKNEIAYQSFFDTITPRDYAIAQFISLNKKPHDTLFIWGNSGQIYKLTSTIPPGRFIVAYHMTQTTQNMLETRQALMQNLPTYIVILPKQDALPYSLFHYKERLIIRGAIIYEHVF